MDKDLGSGQSALDEALAAWNAAAMTWDPQGCADAYAEDAVLFGGRPGHHVGREQIRAYHASYVRVIASCQLRLQDVHFCKVTPDLVMAQGYGRFDMVLADGTGTHSLLRGTLSVVRRDEGWRIFQHHFSATPASPPIGLA